MFDDCKNEKALNITSDEESYDSDLIDSDVEAELYSIIHHETDNSTLNLDELNHSLNTSNKENTSAILDYKEFCSISNISFVETNENKLNNNNKNKSGNVQIIEITDKLSGDKIITDNDNFINSLNDFTFKRKSNSDINFDDNQAFKKQRNDEENTYKSKRIVNLKSNEIVSLSSSDEDDNDIICLGPLDKKQLETNISQVIVTDSDSTDSWCFKSPKINASTPNAAKTKGQWFVNDDDLYRSRKSSSRYHESQFVTCSRCNQKGHSFKFCSFSKGMKCYICGSDHSSFRCKSKVCAKCFGFGHDIKYCPKEIDFCEMCQMPGHHQGVCPDIWRRFQRTTPKKSKNIWRLFQDTPFFCYNCGLPGHFGAICKSRRMNTPAFPTWPFVLKYKVQNQGQERPRPAINVLNEESVVATQQKPKRKKKKKKVKKNLPDLSNMQQTSFPRTPKNSQMQPRNESCDNKNTNSRQKLLKQKAKKAKKWNLERKAMLLQQNQQQQQYLSNKNLT